MDASLIKNKIDKISLFVFCVLVFLLFRQIANQVNTIGDVFIVILAATVGHFLADLFSGLLHWVCDSFGNENTKFWGPAIIGPFRRHHKNPSDICTIPLSENLGSSSIAGNLIGISFLVFTRNSKIESLFILSISSFFIVFAVLSNLFHRWSHLRDEQKNTAIKILQKTRLIISTKHHKKHHANNFRTSYCVSCGWANKVTDNIPWTAIEKKLNKLGMETDFS